MSDGAETSNQDHLISNHQYDVLKFVITLMLPAIGTLYFTLAQLWRFPYANEVVGTVAALATFLGIFLRFAAASYNASESKYDGSISFNSTPTGESTTMGVHLDPQYISTKTEALLKVQPPVS